jgi:uncharacterized coiled-coil protein SlyX
MENIIELLKKHKTKLLILLLVIFFFKSCGNSRNVTKLEKTLAKNVATIDSLNLIVSKQQEQIKVEKIKIHTFYDNWITEKNRGGQLMELHFVVKNNLKELQSE